MRLDGFEEFLRVEHRRALDPGVQRVRCNRVELLPRRQQEMSRIVQLDMGLRIRHDVEVVLGEVVRHDARDERFDFGNGQALDVGIDRNGASGNSRTTADDEYRLRVFRNQGGHVAEHALQPHVLRFARGLDLAGVVIIQHAVRQSRDGDRCVPALANVDDLSLTQPRRRVTTVGDEHSGNRVDGAREQHRGAHRCGQQYRACKLHARSLRLRFRRCRLQHQQCRHG